MRVLVTAGTPSTQGFVLIEVLVSMAIFAIGIMAVLTAVLSALNLQKDSALRYRASLILHDKLMETSLISYNGEPMRGLSADGVFSWTVAGERWAAAPERDDQKKSSSKGRQKNQENETPDLASLVYQVAVDVSWETRRGTRHLNATQLVNASAPVEEAE